MKYSAIFLAACAAHGGAPFLVPASQPASQPASTPAGNDSVPLPEGLFTPLDPAQPNGAQFITRPHLEALAAHMIRQRAGYEKRLADLGARDSVCESERNAANIAAAQSAWKKTWVPILTGVGGAAFSAVVVTLVEWGLGAIGAKAQTAQKR